MKRLSPILCTVFLLLSTFGVAAQQGDGEVVVAWSTEDGLFLWRETAPTANRIYDPAIDIEIAPDGNKVAAWVGGATAAQDQLLILDGQTVRQSIQTTPLQMAWADANTLYYNILTSSDAVAGITHELWRLSVNTGTLEQVELPGFTGDFHISPNGRTIAYTTPGTFDTNGNPAEEGIVRLYDIETGNTQIVLAFTAVATGSSLGYFPPITWRSDSSAFLTAVAPPFLLYDGQGETLLWEITVAGDVNQLGAINADFYSTINWSTDGANLAYQYTGDVAQQQYLAAANGTASTPISSPNSSFFLEWAPTGDRFALNVAFTEGFIGTPAAPNAIAVHGLEPILGMSMVVRLPDANHAVVHANSTTVASTATYILTDLDQPEPTLTLVADNISTGRFDDHAVFVSATP